MKLHYHYPPDFRKTFEMQQFAADSKIVSYANTVLTFVDKLEEACGPEKWLQVNHGGLQLFAADPSVSRQPPQVFVPGPSPRFGEIRFLLPIEHLPAREAIIPYEEVSEAIPLILHALSRCESRQAYLSDYYTILRNQQKAEAQRTV